MDPNEALARARRAAERLLSDGFEWDAAECEALCESLQALDQWLSKGGFLPDDWARGR